jgi:hypothetical protein
MYLCNRALTPQFITDVLPTYYSEFSFVVLLYVMFSPEDHPMELCIEGLIGADYLSVLKPNRFSGNPSPQ